MKYTSSYLTIVAISYFLCPLCLCVGVYLPRFPDVDETSTEPWNEIQTTLEGWYDHSVWSVYCTVGTQTDGSYHLSEQCVSHQDGTRG